MAAIDKIYGTQEQYYELKKWLKENRPRAISELYPEESFNKANRAISNFSSETDMWLIDNCPIEWVVDYIKDQYSMI